MHPRRHALRASSAAALLALLTSLAALSGCSLMPGGSDGEAVARPGADVLIITNSTADSLYYDAIDQSVLEVVLRVSFATPGVYPKIGPGETIRLPYEEVYNWDAMIDDYEPGGPIVATVWRLVPDRDERTGFRVQALYEDVVQPGSAVEVGGQRPRATRTSPR